MFTILLLLLGIIIIAIFVMRQNFSSHLDKLDAEITNSSAPSFPRNDLPPIVMVYVARVGVSHQNISKYVSFDQAGQMWSAPGAKPFDFTATQIISTNEAEFVWRANAYFAGSVLVADYFVKSTGGLEVKLLGTVSLASMVGGESIAKSEALRFLAELPFSPDAILFNTILEWTSIDTKSFKVATGQGKARGEITFRLAEDGLVKTASALLRPYCTKQGSITECPWAGASGIIKACRAV